MPDWAVLTVQIGIGLGTTLYVLWPLLNPMESAGTSGTETVSPGDEKVRVLVDALRDLEYEFDTGKIDREEYDRLRSHYGSKLLEDYSEDQIERFLEDSGTTGGDETDDEEIERAVRQAREKLDQ